MNALRCTPRRWSGCCCACWSNEQDAEAVLQETFLNAFRAIDSFEEAFQPEHLRLYRIAYNAAIDAAPALPQRPHRLGGRNAERDARLRAAPAVRLGAACPKNHYDSAEVQTELRQAIAAMPESLQTVFMLRELEGMSTEETAVTLDISTSAAKVRLHRARQWLRDALDPILAPQDSGRSSVI